MAEIGIFYGSSKGATKKVAKKLQRAFGEERADLHDVRKAKAKRLLDYELILLGSPTYEKGKLQEDWYGFLKKMKKLDLSDKTVAVFALGDQKKYEKTFGDALTPLYKAAKKCGARVVGRWPNERYKFKRSAALDDDHFLGLMIDEDRQASYTAERVQAWADQVVIDWEQGIGTTG